MTLEPEPQRHIGHLIRRAQQVHATMWAEEVSTVVTSVQYGVLTVLERMPGASQKEIGLEASLDKSTVAELLHRMERGGLVRRVRGEEDRRRIVVELTDAGHDELRTLRPRVLRLQERLVAHLDEREAADLRRLLALVVRADAS